MDNLYITIFLSIFFGLPGAALIWFIASLTLFLSTPPEHEKRRKRKILLIISSIVAGVLVTAMVAFLILLLFAIANM